MTCVNKVLIAYHSNNAYGGTLYVDDDRPRRPLLRQVASVYNPGLSAKTSPCLFIASVIASFPFRIIANLQHRITQESHFLIFVFLLWKVKEWTWKFLPLN